MPGRRRRESRRGGRAALGGGTGGGAAVLLLTGSGSGIGIGRVRLGGLAAAEASLVEARHWSARLPPDGREGRSWRGHGEHASQPLTRGRPMQAAANGCTPRSSSRKIALRRTGRGARRRPSDVPTDVVVSGSELGGYEARLRAWERCWTNRSDLRLHDYGPGHYPVRRDFGRSLCRSASTDLWTGGR